MSVWPWVLIFLPSVILTVVLSVLWFFWFRGYIRRDMRRRNHPAEEAVAGAFAAVKSLENDYPELRDGGGTLPTPAQVEILEILEDHAENLSRDPVPVLRMAVQVYRMRVEFRRAQR